MNGLHAWLFRIANDAAKTEQQRAQRLVKEIADLEERKAEAEKELGLARTALSRFDRFEPVINGERQCPICLISDGIPADLKPIESDDGADLYRCTVCHRKMSDR